MPNIDPTQAQIQALLEAPDQGPILMLNQLRFNEQADYAADFKAEPCTGAEAYGRYAEVAVAKITSFGGSIEWTGAPQQTVIGPEGESWDACFVVRYPSKQAFIEMISDPEYQAAVPHRTAALADSRLIRCAEQASPV
jgi:uncharacterized protein (DUF1330 family)